MNFRNKIILGPMAGVNNIAFRRLCTDYGADIVYSQMIDSIAFDRGNLKLADFFDEKNLVAQFFGNDAGIISKCAKKIERKVQAIDLNLGCPHSDVVKRKCGSYLIKYPRRITKIIKALIKAVDVPITVKIRAGYDGKHINAVKIAKLCEKEGIAAIAVHGRARTVNYEKPVDYEIIREVKENVEIPVIGNGDIFLGRDAKRMFDETGCDSIMIGRGAIGNPDIFEKIKVYLKGERITKPYSKRKMFLKYLRYCKKYGIEFKDIKLHSQYLTKGIRHGAELRNQMSTVKDIDGLKKIYDSVS